MHNFLKPKIENIPKELKQRQQWVLWKAVLKGAKVTKIPFTVTGNNASSTKPETWASFEDVANAYSRNGHNFDGIGFVLTKDDPYTGFDFDKCRNPESEETDPNIRENINALDSYSEVSPSGTGYRVIVKATLPPSGRKKGNVECYQDGRYLTITGHSLQGTPKTIEDRQQETTILHAKYFPVNKPIKQRANNHLDEQTLLKRAFESVNGDKIQRLYNGDHSDHPSQSEADQALCNHLAFWMDRDPERIDRVFRISGLYREKWDTKHFSDGRTYGQATIEKAINSCGETYQKPHKDQSGSFKHKEYHFTDMGNAERLVDLYGHDFRYCYPFRQWYVWDGKRWRIDDSGAMRQMCKAMVRGLYREAAEIVDKAQRLAMIDYARRCETVRKAKDMLDFAQSENGIPILPNQLDANAYLITCLNGTIDLKTGEIGPYRKEHLITKLAPANYKPGAECTAWLDHLDKVMDGNDELIRFLQKGFGYSLTGDTSERKIFIQYGSGANGKSVTNDTIALVMGEYAMRTPTETLLIKRSEGIPNDIARLNGARFVYASEAEQGKRLAESLIKDMSGGDKITARYLHKEWFEFYPEFKIWLGTNHKPIIQGTDHAIWDRIRLIPFMVRIPEDEQIAKTEMLEIFKDEIDGIFSWLVEGCLAWQKEGLGLPEKIASATNNYRSEMDILGSFFEDRCVFGENMTVSAKDLYKAYEDWAEENGEKAVTKKMFGMKLTDRNIDSYKGSGNVTMRVGIGLQSE